ncbi:hypothetical protein IFM89_002497, partial [Coptis chinensis]
MKSKDGTPLIINRFIPHIHRIYWLPRKYGLQIFGNDHESSVGLGCQDGRVFDAVEVAGKNVMSTTSTVTTDLVSH